MRLLFYLPDTGSAYLARALAEDVRETFGASEFAAVIRKTSSQVYLERKGVADVFESIVAEPEIFGDGQGGEPDAAELNELESAYGAPTLWQYVTAERYLSMRTQGAQVYKYGTDRSRAELLRFVTHGLRAVEALFDRFQPDAVVVAGVDVGSSVALMIDRVAHARGVPMMVPFSARFGPVTFINDTVYSVSNRLAERYQALRSGSAVSDHREEAIRRLKSFKEGSNDLPHLARNTLSPRRGTLGARLRGALRGAAQQVVSVAREVRSQSWRDFRIVPPHRRLLTEQRIHRNRARILKSSLFHSGKSGERYVLFPLHVEPELSQLLFAPFYTNQLEAVRNVAQSLPANVHLYVKDHQALLGVRSWGYYRKLARIPNVTLIRPTEDTAQLIRNAYGLVTITGTAALEAAFLGTPAVILGTPLFSVADELVTQVASYPDLPNAFADFETWRPTPEAQVDYVAAAMDLGADTTPFVIGQQALDLPVDEVRRLDGYSAFMGLLRERIRESEPIAIR